MSFPNTFSCYLNDEEDFFQFFTSESLDKGVDTICEKMRGTNYLCDKDLGFDCLNTDFISPWLSE